MSQPPNQPDQPAQPPDQPAQPPYRPAQPQYQPGQPQEPGAPAWQPPAVPGQYVPGQRVPDGAGGPYVPGRQVPGHTGGQYVSGQPGPYPPPPAQPPTPPGYPPAPPVPPGGPYGPGAYGPPGIYPPGAYGAQPPKSKRTLFVVLGIVAALLVLCCVGVIGSVLYVRSTEVTTGGPAQPPGRQTQPVSPNPGGSGPNTNQPIGSTLTLTDTRNNGWTITVSDAAWRTTTCSTAFPSPKGKLLVVNVAFEVKQGEASINPVHFKFVDSEGHAYPNTFTTACDNPSLPSKNFQPVGTKISGKVAFDVISSLPGVVLYSGVFLPTASWSVPA